MCNCAFLLMDEWAVFRLDHLELSCFMYLVIAQLDPRVLQAADVILISRVGFDDICQTGEISVLEQVPAEGPRGLVVEGAPSSSESALPTLQRHPGNKNCHTACIHGYMHNRIWRTYKINQYHLSVETFWGPWKGQPSFSSCFLKQEAFTAAVTVHEEHRIQIQQLRAILNL